MKKLIYLTNAMYYSDYEKMLKYVEKMPNPSNQNFHYRFISNLNDHYKVKVISQRPINHINCKLPAVLDEYNHNYYYPGFRLKPVIRNIELYKNSKEIIKSLKVTKDDFVFVDLLNLNLIHLAKFVKRKYKTRIIGILTDNPNNLSDAKKDYIKKIEESFNICDGFIFLTEHLNDYANPQNKPYTIINGVLSYTNLKADVESNFGDYIYFAGALFERYGIINLIESFLKVKTDWKLLIAGHGPLKEDIIHLAESHPRIEFLGSISPYKSLVFARDAKLLVNPRPYNEKLDKYSVPSKVIEYANTGKPVISTKHNQLEKVYGDSILWTNDKNEDLVKAIEEMLKHYDKHLEIAKIAKDRGEFAYGKKVFSQKIQDLLSSFETQ